MKNSKIGDNRDKDGYGRLNTLFAAKPVVRMQGDGTKK